MKNMLLQLKIWKDKNGQDLIEYALMAGFVAVAAGAVMPNVATQINQIFSKIASRPSFNFSAGDTMSCSSSHNRSIPGTLCSHG